MAMDNLVSQTHYQLDALLDKPALIDEKAVAKLNVEMTRASNPVFIIGDEASEAIVSILSIAAEIGAKILVTPHGKGLVSPYHPQFKGVIGFAGHNSAKQLLRDPSVDLVVAIGARFGEFSSNAWDKKLLLNGKLIHVESTEANLTRTPMAKLHVRGCLETIFSRLDSQYKSRKGSPLRAVVDIKDQKNLGMSTVAEGVETEAQRKILEQLGCDTFQGYLVSKPVPPQLFTEQFLTAEKVI
jgi:acetolactate synthase-1/2/3 large subunit